jgi:hypothetical protein
MRWRGIAKGALQVRLFESAISKSRRLASCKNARVGDGRSSVSRSRRSFRSGIERGSRSSSMPSVVAAATAYNLKRTMTILRSATA